MASGIACELETQFANRTSFASDGEDLVIARLQQVFLPKPADYQGFYVDLGAYHPISASTTYAFYKRNWRGLNVEANPTNIPLFHAIRPRDTTLNIGVAGTARSMTYHRFSFDQLNGFVSDERVTELVGLGFQHLGSEEIACRPVHEVINEHVPKDQEIDFLSLDLEGMDDEIWDAWDWSRRPAIIAAELATISRSLKDTIGSPQVERLDALGYDFTARVFQTGFFMRRD